MMIIIMTPEANSENIKAVIEAIQSVGLTAQVMEGAAQKIVSCPCQIWADFSAMWWQIGLLNPA